MRCPEKRTLLIQKIGPILVYRHEDDDSYCPFLDDVSTNVGYSLAEYAKTRGYENEPGIRAALCASGLAREMFAEALEKTQGDAFIPLMKKAAIHCSTSPLLMEFLVSTFGKPCVENIRALLPEEEWPDVMEKYIPFAPPSRTLASVPGVKNTLSVQQLLQRNQKQTTQTIQNTLTKYTKGKKP